MDIDGTKYFFKLGDRSPIIIRLKEFFNSRRYLKARNNRSSQFDVRFQAAIIEFQIYWKMKRQDGSLNAEVYAHIGSVLVDAQIEQISLDHLILKKLLRGVGLVPVRFGLIDGIPNFIRNNVTPLHPNSGKTRIFPSNGNAADNAVDEKLAILFGDEKQKPVVNGANQTGRKPASEHYVLENGLVYVIHIFGQTGNEFIDIYSPKEFEKPVLSPNATPLSNGFFGLVCTNKKTGAVLAFAHLDSIQLQIDLDRAWNSKITNSVGSRYIGTIGTSGGDPGYMHSHIGYYASSKARDIVRSKKVGLNEEHDPKYYIDFRTLINSPR